MGGTPPKELLPPLTKEEITAISNHLKQNTPHNIRNRAIFFLLLDSALRVDECARLKVGDIKHDGTITVLGKGSKERITRIGDTAMKHLRKYLALRNATSESALWIGERGPMTRNGIMETMEKLGKAIGIHLHCHKIRRTACVYMLRNGCPLPILQKLMGHSSILTTQRYLNLCTDDLITGHSLSSPVDNL